ncbi:hypothetical protein D9758_005484 [Tetrapyrgos nigripes]|uniref:Copper radical oxidase n=1 Tax=Tetrapyrgos nigripes TaxID=182062 RepID=A0A8H5GI66_9AGAR|nr:hypothetical protein D9758_005484 [Tetrapyrgos nigripes]
MHLAVTSESTAIILDKVEHNELQVNGHVAWATELNLNSNQVRPLNPLSNTWCSTGSFLGNGTLVSSGGNEKGRMVSNPFVCSLPAPMETVIFFEDPDNIYLTSYRWYPSSVRLNDGSVLIFGGSTTGGYQNSESKNNPTYEFFPSKNINGYSGVQIPSQFLKDTLNGNLFPIMILLPDDNIFVAANQQAMLLNWQTNTERRLPNIPNGVRVSYPYTAGAALLPLKPDNDYAPEVLICGGSTVSDQADPSSLSSQAPPSDQCSRMVLTEDGINAGWSVESMPQARIMPDLLLLPDGRILIINGARTGVAGYGNVGDQVGASNADNPAFSPILYDPDAEAGKRFSDTLAGVTSDIPRMYHSTATLTPNGDILVAGSNPNEDVETREYATEYRFEYFSPPYTSGSRPSYTGLPALVDYNSNFTLSIQLPDGVTGVSVVLIDLGFATHCVHMDQRLIYLKSSLSDDRKTLTITSPPSSTHYPPGPAYLYVVTNGGVPSSGHETLIGKGTSPPQ